MKRSKRRERSRTHSRSMETLRGRLGCALDMVTGKFAEVLYDPDIEMSLAVVKRSLGLAYLRLTHQNGILIQIWCALADAAGKPHRPLSWPR